MITRGLHEHYGFELPETMKRKAPEETETVVEDEELVINLDCLLVYGNLIHFISFFR